MDGVGGEALEIARDKRVLVLWNGACSQDALQPVLTSLRDVAREVLLEHVERLPIGTHARMLRSTGLQLCCL